MSHQNTVTENRRSLLSANNRRPTRPNFLELERADEKPTKKRSRESKYSTDGRVYPLGARRIGEIETIVLDDSSDGGEDNSNIPQAQNSRLHQGALDSESDDDENDRVAQSVTGQPRRPAAANKLRKSNSAQSLESLPSADEHENPVPTPLQAIQSGETVQVASEMPQSHPMDSENPSRCTESAPKKQRLNGHTDIASTKSKSKDVARKAIEALLEQQEMERQERARTTPSSLRSKATSITKNAKAGKPNTFIRSSRESISREDAISKPDTNASAPKELPPPIDSSVPTNTPGLLQSTSKSTEERPDGPQSIESSRMRTQAESGSGNVTSNLQQTLHQNSETNPRIGVAQLDRNISSKLNPPCVPEDSSISLLNISEICKDDHAALDRQMFFAYRARRFDFPRDSHLKNFSPFASAADEMEGISSKDVCAVCGSGEVEFCCLRCPLGFHLKCLYPSLKANDPRPLFCRACASVKGDDKTPCYRPQVAPRPLPARVMGFYRLAADSAQGNPMDFVLHPSIHKFYVDRYESDWLRCYRCKRIRFVNQRTLSEVVKVPFECSDAFWVLPEEQKSCSAVLSSKERSLADAAEKLVKLRSKRRVRLFYSGFGEKNRALFGYHSMQEIIVLDDDESGSLPLPSAPKLNPVPLNDADKELMCVVERKPTTIPNSTVVPISQIPSPSNNPTNTVPQAAAIGPVQSNTQAVADDPKLKYSPKEDKIDKTDVTSNALSLNAKASSNPGVDPQGSVDNERNTSSSQQRQLLSNLISRSQGVSHALSAPKASAPTIPIQSSACSVLSPKSRAPTTNGDGASCLSVGQALQTMAKDLLTSSRSAQQYVGNGSNGAINTSSPQVARVPSTVQLNPTKPASANLPPRPAHVSTVNPRFHTAVPSVSAAVPLPRTTAAVNPSPISAATGYHISSPLTHSYVNTPANPPNGISLAVPPIASQRLHLRLNMNAHRQRQQMTPVQTSEMLPTRNNSNVRPTLTSSQIMNPQLRQPRNSSPNATWNLHVNGAQNSESIKDSILSRIGEFGQLGPLEDMLVDLAMSGNTKLFQLYKTLGRNPEMFARQSIRLAKAISASSSQNGPPALTRSVPSTNNMLRTPSNPLANTMLTPQANTVINRLSHASAAALHPSISNATMQGSMPRQRRGILTSEQRVQLNEQFRKLRVMQMNDCIRLEQVMIADMENALNVDLPRVHTRHMKAKKKMSEVHTNQLGDLIYGIRPTPMNPRQH